MKYLISLLTISAFLGISLLTNEPVFAQTPVPYDFTFQPTNLVVNAHQGDSFKEDVYVLNRSDVNHLHVRLYIQNFKSLDGSGAVSFYSTTSTQTNLASWITPELATVDLLPQEGQYETLDFSIPSYIKPATYTGVLFIEEILPGVSKTSTEVVARAGINILLTVFKNQSEYSQLYTGDTLDQVSVPLVNSQTASISGHIENSSPFAVSNTLSLTVSNIFGQTVKKETFSDIDVLPGTYRYLDGKDGTVEIEGLMPGLYKASIILTDNLQGTSKTTILYFTIVPIYITITLLLILVAVISFIAYAIFGKRIPS